METIERLLKEHQLSALMPVVKADNKDDYERWKYQCEIVGQVSYFITLFFLLWHPIIMALGYDMWANYNYGLIAHSMQMMILAAFCWAVPDEKYEYWIKNHLWVYYVLAIFNSLIFTVGSIICFYFYYFGPGLYSFLATAFLLYLYIACGPLLLTILTSLIYISLKIYAKPDFSAYSVSRE